MHPEVTGELPDRGQVLAGSDAALGNGLAQADGDLVLERAGVVDVDPNHALTVSDNDTVGKRRGGLAPWEFGPLMAPLVASASRRKITRRLRSGIF